MRQKYQSYIYWYGGDWGTLPKEKKGDGWKTPGMKKGTAQVPKLEGSNGAKAQWFSGMIVRMQSLQT